MIIRRIIGKKGRTTIPYVMRSVLDIHENDVVVYCLTEDKSAVVIAKEAYPSRNVNAEDEITDVELFDFVASLPNEYQKAIFLMLLDKYANPKRGEGGFRG